VVDHAFAERTTFVITPDHKVHAVIGGVSPTANVEAALKVVQALAKAKS
jgi:peroxiredoxin